MCELWDPIIITEAIFWMSPQLINKKAWEQVAWLDYSASSLELIGRCMYTVANRRSFGRLHLTKITWVASTRYRLPWMLENATSTRCWYLTTIKVVYLWHLSTNPKTGQYTRKGHCIEASNKESTDCRLDLMADIPLETFKRCQSSRCSAPLQLQVSSTITDCRWTIWNLCEKRTNYWSFSWEDHRPSQPGSNYTFMPLPRSRFYSRWPL